MKLEYIIGVEFIVNILFIIGLFILILKYNKLKNENYVQKGDINNYRSRLSMVEYHYRKFKEGTNPYTAFRDIGEVIARNNEKN